MSSFTLEGLNTLTGLADRNLLAELRIGQIAAAHGGVDAIIGGFGAIVPGMAPAALVTAMTLQVPVYQTLVQDLGRIYSAPPDRLTAYTVLEGAAIGSAGILSAEFGSAFLWEIAPSLLMECGLGVFAAMIPILGVWVGAALDYAIAATMTWRVGTMASIYFQNGNHWVGDRQQSYRIAKKLTGAVSRQTEDRLDFDSIPRQVPEVGESQIETAIGLIRMLRKMQPNVDDECLRDTMIAQGLPIAPIDEALRRTKRPGVGPC